MNNVASLQNSKKLYELSGWDDTYWVHSVDEWGDMPDVETARSVGMVYGRASEAPAYECGYLLRRIEKTILTSNGGIWTATYIPSLDVNSFRASEAGTPEDALCLLAIKLFEEGVLTKEEN